MNLEKTIGQVVSDKHTFIGLGHFDKVEIIKQHECILTYDDPSNKKSNCQRFYLYSNQELIFKQPFMIFVFSYYRKKQNIIEEGMIKLHTTNNANEVFFYQSDKLEDCFKKAVEIRKKSEFTHTVLCFNRFRKRIIDKNEIISKMIVRIIVNDYEKLNKFKQYAGFDSFGHKFGNYDSFLFKENIPTTLAMQYFMPNSDKYIYNTKWSDMTLTSACTEFYFEDNEYSILYNILDEINKEKPYQVLSINSILDNENITQRKERIDLIKAGQKFCDYFNLCDPIPSVLMPILSIFMMDLNGAYSDYAILNFWGPLKMLLEKLIENKEYISNVSLYELVNEMNNVISDIFNSTLHTFQLPIPVEPSCSIHVFLILRYVAFLNEFVSITEEFCNDDFNEKEFHLSFLFNSIDSYIINTTTCFKKIESLPNSRLVIINMPRKYLTKPSLLLSISLHELAHSMDYVARNRKARYKYIKRILMAGFINMIISSVFSYYFELYQDEVEGYEKACFNTKKLGIKALIKEEMDDFNLDEEDGCIHYYYVEIKKKLIDSFVTVIKEKSNIIARKIANKDINNTKGIMRILDRNIFDFLFSEKKWALEKSLEDIYYVFDECFSDIIMISTLDLKIFEYENILKLIDSRFEEHSNRDTIRSRLIKEIYINKTNENNKIKISKNKENYNFERLGVLSYPNVIKDMKKFLLICKKTFEKEISNLESVETLRSDYKQICQLEKNESEIINKSVYELFDNYQDAIYSFRDKIYREILSFTI